MKGKWSEQELIRCKKAMASDAMKPFWQSMLTKRDRFKAGLDECLKHPEANQTRVFSHLAVLAELEQMLGEYECACKSYKNVVI